ncbi:hypothetical protein HanIR_Chr14g0677411 [Helianthus annuus]|nr:hypothetical protein HanIR_Chr14g0677411 [Helianthus annuus]
MFPDKSVGRSTKGESKPEYVVRNTSSRSVQHVGEHDVHRVFGSDRPSAKHGEPELHGEHEVGREEEVGVVYGVCCVGEFV